MREGCLTINRKFHMSHCPSCEFYVPLQLDLRNESPMTRTVQGCRESGRAIYLQGSTEIKCKYYKEVK